MLRFFASLTLAVSLNASSSCLAVNSTPLTTDVPTKNTLAESTLVGSGSQPVAQLFRSLLSKLKQETSVPILLPSQLPSDLLEGRVVDVVDGSGDANGYIVLLLGPPRCGKNACRSNLGSFKADKGEDFGRASSLPSTQLVTLAKGIPGYYHPSTCGGSCSTPQLEWQYEGVLYNIEFLPNSQDASKDEAFLLMMANSAIEAGSR